MNSARNDELEAVIRRKLLYDGNGTFEDKRLVNLIKNITRFCIAQDTPEETMKLYSLINKDLLAATNAAEKHVKISQMCDQMYLVIEEAIETQTIANEQIRTKLANLQLELEFVDKIKNINQYPDCHTTEQTMKIIETKKDLLMRRIAGQSCNLRTLSEACTSLRKVIEDDEQAELEFHRADQEL